MKTIKFGVFCAIFHSASAFSATPQLAPSDPTCQLNDTTAKQVVKFDGSPSYFAKANMDIQRNKIYFKHSGSGNVSLDLATGRINRLPGTIDPVPTPDGRFVTIPGISYYDADEVERGQQRVVHRGSLGSVYQSIGLLAGGTNEERTYRAIADANPARGGVKYVDSRIRGTGASARGQDVGSGTLCAKIDGRDAPTLRLPMIAKNGQMLAAYDSDTGSTKVFDVNPSNPSLCTTRVDLGLPTGKAEFNLENNKIVFHVDTSRREEGAWFAGPSAGRNMNVFAYDLNSRQITRITNNTDGNSYYPSFRSDGSVVYLQGDKDRKYAAVVADPSLGRSMALPSACSPDDPSFQKTLALGKLWANLCSQLSDSTTAQATALYALSLDPDQCRAMVQTYWSRNREQVASDLGSVPNANGVRPREVRRLSAEDLMSVCSTQARPRSNPTVVSPGGGTVDPPPTMNLARLVNQCRGCHGAELFTSAGRRIAPFPPESDLSNNDWLSRDSGDGHSWKDRIRAAVSPGGSMNTNFMNFVPTAGDQQAILNQLR